MRLERYLEIASLQDILDTGDRTLIASLKNTPSLTPEEAGSSFSFGEHLLRCQVQFWENSGLNAIGISEQFDLVLATNKLVN